MRGLIPRPFRVPALALCLTVSCRIVERFPTTNIPDDAVLGLAFTCDKDAAPVAHECDVQGTVTLATGEGAGPGWTVDVLTTGGSFVPLAGDSIIRARRVTTGAAGQFAIPYRTPTDPATVMFTVAAHGVTKSEMLKVVNNDAGDDPPVATIALTPAAVTVKKGDSVHVVATFLQANKTPLAGRLAYFSIDDTGKASVVSTPTDAVWVKGLDIGTATLFVSRRAVHATAAVTITP